MIEKNIALGYAALERSRYDSAIVLLGGANALLQVDSITESIASTARTDSIGDGKVFVLNVEEALRIRTGETGAGAL